eukprot:SAG31_NODE_969_length_10677_cov_7.080072_7_plen_123_part_00
MHCAEGNRIDEVSPCPNPSSAMPTARPATTAHMAALAQAKALLGAAADVRATSTAEWVRTDAFSIFMGFFLCAPRNLGLIEKVAPCRACSLRKQPPCRSQRRCRGEECYFLVFVGLFSLSWD